MQEAVSNSYVMTIVLVIIGICAIIITTSVVYSKTYKIKNRIIEIIENYNGYDETNAEMMDEINLLLKDSGYPIIKKDNETCPAGRGSDAVGLDDKDKGNVAINTLSNYKYCIYRYKTSKGYYYSVATFLRIDFPLIGDYISIDIPVYGETKVFVNF